MGRQPYLGIVGNGRTSALVAPDLSVAWLSVPRCDGVPVFAGALDSRRGGSLAVGLEVEGQPIALAPVGQSYRGRSAVLDTRLAGEGWELRTHDFMPWGLKGLVRELSVRSRGPGGRVRLRVEVRPVRSALWPLRLSALAGTIRVEGAGAAAVVAARPGAISGGSGARPPEPAARPLWASPAVAVTSGGEHSLVLTVDLGWVPGGGVAHARLTVAYGASLGEAESALGSLRGASAAAEVRWWEEWLAPALPLPGPVPADREEAYWRSLIVLKLLSFEPTGALLAAPTASFPAVPGGTDNWDYRYVWLRDGYLSAMAFDAAGLHQDARRFYDFAFALQGRDGHWAQPLYTVDGGDPPEAAHSDLVGPDGARPVRFGNAAARQLQLDSEGSLLQGLWFHYRTSRDLDALTDYWKHVRRAADWLAENWRWRESGMWEVREYVAHWVYGKAMSYAGLRAAARIAATLGRPDEAARWEEAAGRVRRHVVTRAWSRRRRAFLARWGRSGPPAGLDASVLALAFYGLVHPEDPRMVSTVQAMRRPQAEGGLWHREGLCRWEGAPFPFYLSSFWLARYLLMAARGKEADQLVDRLLASSTDLFLMGEHFDGVTGRQWGNFPQAFSHEELVRITREIAQGWSYHAWEYEPWTYERNTPAHP